MIHLVVPRARLSSTVSSMDLMIASTAAIWVPPAMRTGMLSAAPAMRPAAGAIMGSPTACTAAMASFFNASGLRPLAAMPSATTCALSSCGFTGNVLATFPLASYPNAVRTPRAVVVPPGMDSPTTR